VKVDLGNGVFVDPYKQLAELDKIECEDSLYMFLKRAWRIMDAAVWKDGWPIEAIAEHLQAVADGDIRRLIINIPPRMGKQVADDTPVLTTLGWKTHGNLVVGDYVFHPSGSPIKVLAVSGKTPSDVRVEFFDGSVVYCHENHEWTLFNRSVRKWETVEAGAFLKPRRGRWGVTSGSVKQVTSCGRALYQLPFVEPVQFPEAKLALHPYVLGAWLGDGSKGKPCITHSPSDTGVVEKIVSLGYPVSTVCEHKGTGALTTYFAGAGRKVAPRLTRELRDIGVFEGKFVPSEYLRSSVQQRLELLAGLMDTDGHVDRAGRCHFSNTSANLISGVSELVRSFGWRASLSCAGPRLSTSCVQGKMPVWTVSFQPTMPIPTALGRKAITRIAPRRQVGLKSVVRDACGKVGHCIEVDSHDGLYLVGDHLTPTHNSSITSVAFPAWVWSQGNQTATSGPGTQILSASYSTPLALRDSVKCRRLIESPWYQENWGETFALNSDQNTKSRFSNDKGGERLITSVGANVTGEGGNIIIVDDPNAANEAFSEATIEATIDWWDGTMSTRHNDPKLGASVIIQQRLAEDDLTGHVLEKSVGDWQHLCLPMRYEASRSFHTVLLDGETFWKDPRTTEGELLWEERFGEKEIVLLEKTLGPYGAAGQLQQRPEPAGGGIIKRDWWKLWEAPSYPPMDFIVASLDTAYTTATQNDASALTVWGVFTSQTQLQSSRIIGRDGTPAYSEAGYAEGSPKVMMMHAWQERMEIHDLVKRIEQTCKAMKVDLLLIENKASGISVSQEIRRMYSNARFAVQLSNPGSQDKMSRLYSIQHIFSEGMVYAPDRVWAEMVMTQVGQFPKGKHDDLVDTVSQAIRRLRDMGLLERSDERLQDLEEAMHITDNEQPLYPA